MLYHDMDQKLMVYFTAGKDQGEITKLSLGSMMNGYQFRITASRNELLEKVWIVSADFDDRAMELYKLYLERHIPQAADGDLFFCGTRRNAEGKDLVFFVCLTAEGSGNLSLPLESYTEFVEGVAAILENEPSLIGEWHSIDRRYAESIMEKYLSGE